MGFLATVKSELECSFVTADGKTYTHVCRGVDVKEFRRLMDEFDRNGVTGDEDTGGTEQQKDARLDDARTRWFVLWGQIRKRMVGYLDNGEVIEGEACDQFVRGETKEFKTLDPEARKIAVDLLAFHVQKGCESWMRENVARYSFRLEGEAGDMAATA